MMRRTLLLILSAWLVLPVFSQENYKLKKYDIPSGHYSGITPVGDNRYAVVSDKDKALGFHQWHIVLDTENGTLMQVEYEGFRGIETDASRDEEGIAFCPSRGTLFISGEADQRILEHRMDGGLTGEELAIPPTLGKDRIQPNRGFEALGFDVVRQLFWTVTESALKGDDPGLLRLQTFRTDLLPEKEYVYQLDAEQARNHGRDHYHGLVAITPLPDGRLLTLEREARIARHYNGSRCWCKLFLYSPETGEKELLDSWKTRFAVANQRFANYEGMCLGPVLADGRQTIFLVSDAQGAYGRALWHLKDWMRIYAFRL